jgi:hypothetical protein
MLKESLQPHYNPTGILLGVFDGITTRDLLTDEIGNALNNQLYGPDSNPRYQQGFMVPTRAS